jgi:hypothetical protein
LSIKPEQFKADDLLVRISEWASPEEPFEQTGLQALTRMFKEEMKYSSVSDPNYQFTLYKVKGIKKGKVELLNPVSNQPDDEHGHFRYCMSDLLRFDKEKFNNVIKLNPPKFKIGDKVVNPYMNWTSEQIKNCTYPDEYNIEAYVNVGMEKGDDPVRFYKSVPFLEVMIIRAKVTFNVRYQKFLSMIDYEYYCRQPSSNAEVDITFNAVENQMSIYTPYNTLWDSVCISPSPAT